MLLSFVQINRELYQLGGQPPLTRAD
jgi:hypothetical protein